MWFSKEQYRNMTSQRASAARSDGERQFSSLDRFLTSINAHPKTVTLNPIRKS
jgi:hypothetical protein